MGWRGSHCSWPAGKLINVWGGREFEHGCEKPADQFTCLMKEKKERCQCFWPLLLPQELYGNPLKFTSCKNSVETSSRHESIIFHHYVLGNAQKKKKRKKAFQHFPVLKPSPCQPLGKAIVHLEKDKAACDGGVSIKLAMWTDGFD